MRHWSPGTKEPVQQYGGIKERRQEAGDAGGGCRCAEFRIVTGLPHLCQNNELFGSRWFLVWIMGSKCAEFG